MHKILPLLSIARPLTTVMGGSVLSSYGLEDEKSNVTNCLKEINPELVIEREISVMSMTFAQAIRHLDTVENTDILVFLFGTSVGWPRISRKLEEYLRPELMTPTAMHIPVYKSSSKQRRLRSKVRHFYRNILKILLFPLGLYRPRQSIEGLPEILDSICDMAESRAKLIIWVQHNSLGYRRLFLERRVYDAYFNSILKHLQNKVSPHFRLLAPDKSFLIQDNFLLDGVHLSPLGHKRMAQHINSEINSALLFAKSFIRGTN